MGKPDPAMKYLFSFILAFLFAVGIIAPITWQVLGPVNSDKTEHVFVVPDGGSEFDVPAALFKDRLIRNETAFRWFMTIVAAGKSVVPGGYRLNPSMSAREMVTRLTGVPQFVWVGVREGLRKEQIGELLAVKLGWTEEQERIWNEFDNNAPEYQEGVYFPDTYLLPSDEPVAHVALTFINRFHEKVGPYLDTMAAKNIKWTTAVNIASLIERESGGDSDKKLIAGIIWNRLNKDMPLQIDATLQYIKGDKDDGWWPRVRSADKFIDSPYNTYDHKGLPPGPISNPGLAAITAALDPEQTDCIFYLHAPDRQIYCSVTYTEHVANIEAYLN